MAILRLAFLSLWNRRVIAGLTVLAVALSVCALLGVEKLRRNARDAFANTLSGTDLIVGARSGAVQLLLYSVFRIGNATNNISWKSYLDIADHPRVKWAVPIALGDSHRGYRVVGTSPAYFEHYGYAGKRRLRLAAGKTFKDLFDVVLGSEVARALRYEVGDPVVVSHGAGELNIVTHDDKPFRVSGILAPTGTPVDRTLHISLAGYEAMHLGWESGRPASGALTTAEAARRMDLTPKAITAFLVGLDSRIAVFGVQRHVNQYAKEPLLAVIPGVALQELWELIGVAEDALALVSAMVVVTGLLGMVTVIASGLEARRREMAVLRSVGARPVHVFALFMSEAGLLALVGVGSGTLALYLSLFAIQPLLASEFGLHVRIGGLTPGDLTILGAVVAAGFLIGLVPALRAYRMSLADGLSVRL